MYNRSTIRGLVDRFAFLTMVLTWLACSQNVRGGDQDLNKLFQESIPDSPFIGVVYAYADAMLEHGRDTYGSKKTGVLLSALDRKTLAPLEARLSIRAGVSQGSRPSELGGRLVGGNPELDENLLRLLYFLTELSGEDRYARAADDELKWFLDNAPPPGTGLPPWRGHLSWDVMTDTFVSGTEDAHPLFSRPWMLWDRCFALAPQQSRRFALAVRNQQVVDQKTGKIRPGANDAANGFRSAGDRPREAGFLIRTWAEAFAHTEDEGFLTAIDAVLTECENNLFGPAQSTLRSVDSPNACPVLSLAIDCDGAARKVPEPLRTRLTAFAARADAWFCALPHELKQKQGFVESYIASPPHTVYTSLWDPGQGSHTTAAVGVMCRSRYENTGKISYRRLILAAADAYLNSLPEGDVDAWPLTFGQAITVELAAWRITAGMKYRARAFKLGETAIEKFFGLGPLPRASLKSDHYENATGADTLALALAELHMSIRTITVVRTPANTIDR